MRQRFDAMLHPFVAELVGTPRCFVRETGAGFARRLFRERLRGATGQQRDKKNQCDQAPLGNSIHGGFRLTKAQSRRSGTDAITLLPPLCGEGNLLLPGAFLVAMQTQFLAPFVFVDFGLPTFFQ
jgi:hypothetical protein